MFLPATIEEMNSLGWDKPDVILVSGDAYVDAPSVGIAVIGRCLMNAGFRTAVIPQPADDSPADITRFGEPRLFWGVTSGCVDSMVSNYTASKKWRGSDDLTAGGINNRRPDRAVIKYTNLIRRYFKNTAPIVLGGIEASLRRTAHYDWWSDSVRRSVLFDAKADIIVYGMGERQVVELAECMRDESEWRSTAGICFIAKNPPADYIELPDYESCAADKKKFAAMFGLLYKNSLSPRAPGLAQRHGDRWLVHNPPAKPLEPDELDAVNEFQYERAAHPVHEAEGAVRALDTIRFSVTTHRGCAGECNFCSIAVHQGKTIISRSADSIVREIESMTAHPLFKGIIADIGGPTANMYKMTCPRMDRRDPCTEKRCLYPSICTNLKISHAGQIDLLDRCSSLKGVKKLFIASGIRHDIVLADGARGEDYLRRVLERHASGRIRVAPEHTELNVLDRMGKPGFESFEKFISLFNKINRGKKTGLSCYFIAAHPGSTAGDMKALRRSVSHLISAPIEDVQIFTPLPSTWSALMYYTGEDPISGENIFVEKNPKSRIMQKSSAIND